MAEEAALGTGENEAVEAGLESVAGDDEVLEADCGGVTAGADCGGVTAGADSGGVTAGLKEEVT